MTPDSPQTPVTALAMPRTRAGRELLAIPLIDGDDAPLYLTADVLAIEDEMADLVRREARAAFAARLREAVELLDDRAAVLQAIEEASK